MVLRTTSGVSIATKVRIDMVRNGLWFDLKQFSPHELQSRLRRPLFEAKSFIGEQELQCQRIVRVGVTYPNQASRLFWRPARRSRDASSRKADIGFCNRPNAARHCLSHFLAYGTASLYDVFRNAEHFYFRHITVCD